MFKHIGKPVFNLRNHKQKNTDTDNDSADDSNNLSSLLHQPDSSSAIEANADPEVLAERRAVDAFKQGLKFPANLISNSEARMYYKMGTSHQQMKKTAWLRLIACAGAFIIFPLFSPGSLMLWGTGLLAAIAVWFAVRMSVKNRYKLYAIRRQLHFDQFMSVITPYLYRMNGNRRTDSDTVAGMSINAILTHVSDQIDDKQTKEQIARLNVDIKNNKYSPKPYINFARRFSESGRAYMFMMSVFRMAQGAADDNAIRNLNSGAMADLLSQVRKIKKAKLYRFAKPIAIIVVSWIFVLTAYFALSMAVMVIKQVKSLN